MFSHSELVGREGHPELGCRSIPGWLLDQNDGAFSLGMEGQHDLSLSHCVLKALHRTAGMGINISPFSGLDFAGGRWGSAGCSHPWQGMGMNTAEPSSVFWCFFHCCEPVQPHSVSRACLGWIAPSPRQQALLCFLSLLCRVLGAAL